MNDIIIKKSNFIYWLFFFFCFFPFINILRLPTDSQPNALILAIIIVAMNYKLIFEHFPGKLILFLFLFSFSLIPFFYSNLNIDTIISLISYLSLLIVPLAVFISLFKLKGVSFKFLFFVILIWFLVALVQRFLYADFLSFLLSRNSGSGFMGRGVNSLAPEPTFYGTTILLFTIIYFLNFYNRHDHKFVLAILFLQLFILSLSSTIFAVLSISFVIYFLIKIFKMEIGSNSIILILVSFLVLFILYQIFSESIIETRIYKILDILISNPELILLDESINERVNHALFPLLSLYDNFGLPMGYGNFQDYILKKTSDPNYYFFFERLYIDHYKKVMSGYGAVFFELGIFGMSVPYYLYIIFRKTLKNNYFLLIFITLNLLLFTSISFNNPLILFVFGNILYLNYSKHYNFNEFK